jgi:hypothetical protein
MTDDRNSTQAPVPIPEAVLDMVAGGQSLSQMLQDGLISSDQYNWLIQHPSGAGRGG